LSIVAYSLSFVFVAVACGVIAATVPSLPVQVAAGWVGLAFLLVAVAYGLNAAGVFGKRSSGGRWPWAWPLTGPYLILTEVSYRIWLRTSGENEYVAVAENLYLGRRLLPREAAAAVAEHRFHAVLDLAAEFAAPGPFRNLPHYRSVPVLDASAPSAEQLRDATAFLTARVPNGPVYVHCALGHGRSALAVAAYLIAVGIATSPKTAVAAIKAVRPKAKLTEPQWKELIAFARSISR
jgi:protein-tyrosine phosphatase